jgi:hypothetical protein
MNLKLDYFLQYHSTCQGRVKTVSCTLHTVTRRINNMQEILLSSTLPHCGVLFGTFIEYFMCLLFLN